MFEMFRSIQNIISIVAVLGMLGAGIWGHNKKEEAERYYNNYQKEKSEWVDEKGRLVSEITETVTSNQRLKAVHKRDSVNLSEADKQLKQAAKNIEELGLRLKDVKTYYEGKIGVFNDSLVSVLEKNDKGEITGLKPIKTEHLEIDFVVESNDTILITHKYNTDIVIVANRKPTMYTKNGNKRFFIFRKIWPRWKYWHTARVEDPNASINIEVVFNFD